MAVFMARRLLSLVLVLLGMSLVTFLVTNLVPADPARVAAGPDATAEVVERVRAQLGLDKPLYVQYGIYLKNLLTLNLGTSVWSRQPIAWELARHIPATVELGLMSMIVFVALSIPLGVIAAVRRSSWLDSATRIFAVGGAAIAPFWLALVLQLVFYRFLGWLPAGGRLALSATPPPAITGLYVIDSLLTVDFVTLGEAVKHLILPVTTLALGRLAITVRMVRSQMILELNQDYVRTARSKGLAERIVVYRHALKNALNPIVTMIGIQSAYLLSGTVLIESIFRWPGLGAYALDSILNLDFPAVMGVALTVSVFFVVLNLVVDVLYALLDPRVRLS